MWGRKRRAARDRQRSIAAFDTGQAQAIRREAVREMAELKAQQAEVESLARKLNRRRALNHFGQDVQITFTPRGGHT